MRGQPGGFTIINSPHQVVGAGLAGSGTAGVAAAAAAAAALPPRILNITVPQVGHLPLMARRPFFIVSSAPSTICFLALHLTQYPSGIEIILPGSFMPQGSHANSLEGSYPHRQQGRMEEWNDGKMEGWNDGMVEWWNYRDQCLAPK